MSSVACLGSVVCMSFVACKGSASGVQMRCEIECELGSRDIIIIYMLLVAEDPEDTESDDEEDDEEDEVRQQQVIYTYILYKCTPSMTGRCISFNDMTSHTYCNMAYSFPQKSRWRLNE